jgi:hypothetical protein
MRQTQKFGTLCIFIVLAAPVAAVAHGQGSCQQIRAACQSAGFAQGAAKLGIGLQVDCIVPIMSGPGQRPSLTESESRTLLRLESVIWRDSYSAGG